MRTDIKSPPNVVASTYSIESDFAAVVQSGSVDTYVDLIEPPRMKRTTEHSVGSAPKVGTTVATTEARKAKNLSPLRAIERIGRSLSRNNSSPRIAKAGGAKSPVRVISPERREDVPYPSTLRLSRSPVRTRLASVERSGIPQQITTVYSTSSRHKPGSPSNSGQTTSPKNDSELKAILGHAKKQLEDHANAVRKTEQQGIQPLGGTMGDHNRKEINRSLLTPRTGSNSQFTDEREGPPTISSEWMASRPSGGYTARNVPTTTTTKLDNYDSINESHMVETESKYGDTATASSNNYSYAEKTFLSIFKKQLPNVPLSDLPLPKDASVQLQPTREDFHPPKEIVTPMHTSPRRSQPLNPHSFAYQYLEKKGQALPNSHNANNKKFEDENYPDKMPQISRVGSLKSPGSANDNDNMVKNLVISPPSLNRKFESSEEVVPVPAANIKPYSKHEVQQKYGNSPAPMAALKTSHQSEKSWSAIRNGIPTPTAGTPTSKSEVNDLITKESDSVVKMPTDTKMVESKQSTNEVSDTKHTEIDIKSVHSNYSNKVTVVDYRSIEQVEVFGHIERNEIHNNPSPPKRRESGFASTTSGNNLDTVPSSESVDGMHESIASRFAASPQPSFNRMLSSKRSVGSVLSGSDSTKMKLRSINAADEKLNALAASLSFVKNSFSYRDSASISNGMKAMGADVGETKGGVPTNVVVSKMKPPIDPNKKQKTRSITVDMKRSDGIGSKQKSTLSPQLDFDEGSEVASYVSKPPMFSINTNDESRSITAAFRKFEEDKNDDHLNVDDILYGNSRTFVENDGNRRDDESLKSWKRTPFRSKKIAKLAKLVVGAAKKASQQSKTTETIDVSAGNVAKLKEKFSNNMKNPDIIGTTAARNDDDITTRNKDTIHTSGSIINESCVTIKNQSLSFNYPPLNTQTEEAVAMDTLTLSVRNEKDKPTPVGVIDGEGVDQIEMVNVTDHSADRSASKGKVDQVNLQKDKDAQIESLKVPVGGTVGGTVGGAVGGTVGGAVGGTVGGTVESLTSTDLRLVTDVTTVTDDVLAPKRKKFNIVQRFFHKKKGRTELAETDENSRLNSTYHIGCSSDMDGPSFDANQSVTPIAITANEPTSLPLTITKGDELQASPQRLLTLICPPDDVTDVKSLVSDVPAIVSPQHSILTERARLCLDEIANQTTCIDDGSLSVRNVRDGAVVSTAAKELADPFTNSRNSGIGLISGAVSNVNETVASTSKVSLNINQEKSKVNEAKVNKKAGTRVPFDTVLKETTDQGVNRPTSNTKSLVGTEPRPVVQAPVEVPARKVSSQSPQETAKDTQSKTPKTSRSRRRTVGNEVLEDAPPPLREAAKTSTKGVLENMETEGTKKIDQGRPAVLINQDDNPKTPRASSREARANTPKVHSSESGRRPQADTDGKSLTGKKPKKTDSEQKQKSTRAAKDEQNTKERVTSAGEEILKSAVKCDKNKGHDVPEASTSKASTKKAAHHDTTKEGHIQTAPLTSAVCTTSKKLNSASVMVESEENCGGKYVTGNGDSVVKILGKIGDVTIPAPVASPAIVLSNAATQLESKNKKNTLMDLAKNLRNISRDRKKRTGAQNGYDKNGNDKDDTHSILSALSDLSLQRKMRVEATSDEDVESVGEVEENKLEEEDKGQLTNKFVESLLVKPRAKLCVEQIERDAGLHNDEIRSRVSFLKTKTSFQSRTASVRHSGSGAYVAPTSARNRKMSFGDDESQISRSIPRVISSRMSKGTHGDHEDDVSEATAPSLTGHPKIQTKQGTKDSYSKKRHLSKYNKNDDSGMSTQGSRTSYANNSKVSGMPASSTRSSRPASTRSARKSYAGSVRSHQNSHTARKQYQSDDLSFTPSLGSLPDSDDEDISDPYRRRGDSETWGNGWTIGNGWLW